MHRRSTLQLTAIETEVEACVSGTVRAEARELAKGPGQMQGGDWARVCAKHCKALQSSFLSDFFLRVATRLPAEHQDQLRIQMKT